MALSTDQALFDAIVEESKRESVLWAEACLSRHERELVPIFSALCDDRYKLGVETIYEGYLVHYGRPRLFDPPDGDAALLLGDYLYAHGLVRIAQTGDVGAVRDLAELISLCAQARAEERDGDGVAWAATAALLGRGALEDARAALRDRADVRPLEQAARGRAGDAAVDGALAAHADRVG
jgi:hypothetical protein